MIVKRENMSRLIGGPERETGPRADIIYFLAKNIFLPSFVSTISFPSPQITLLGRHFFIMTPEAEHKTQARPKGLYPIPGGPQGLAMHVKSCTLVQSEPILGLAQDYKKNINVFFSS